MAALICFALKEEAAPFHQVAAGKPGIFTIITGMGCQNAAKSVRGFLEACSPGLVLTCGFAGGLNPDLKFGDVVFEIDTRQSSIGNQSQLPDAGYYERLLAAGAKPVKFCCVDRIATTVVEKKKLRDQTGADAVEMESAAIQAVCRERGLPCLVVRVISDAANESLPLDFNALAKPDKSLDFVKLSWAIAKAPGKIGELMVLQRKTRFAATQLASVLGRVISP